MNSLSWMIYWIGAIDHLSRTLLILTFLAPLIMLGAFGLTCIWVDDAYEPQAKSAARIQRDLVFRRFVKTAIGSAAALLLFSFIPSRQTLLLIAGSEIGQRLTSSDEVRSVVDPGVTLLKTWISEETKRLTEPRK